MTGSARNGESVWEGPEWAAPERAERLASRPTEGGRDVTLGLMARWLANGDIDPVQFQRAVQLNSAIRRKEQA